MRITPRTAFSFLTSRPPTLNPLVPKFAWQFGSKFLIWAPSSEFVSSSIPSWQILTAHAQPFRVARDLAFCLKVPLDSLLVWASSGGSGEPAHLRSLARTSACRIGDKYQIRLMRPICTLNSYFPCKITRYSITRSCTFATSLPMKWQTYNLYFRL